MDKFLITGFSGFVGQHFVRYLEERGERCFVKGLDVHYPDFAIDGHESVKVSFEKVNLLSKDRVEYTIHEFQPNYILHLASFSSVAFSWKDPVQSFQNNSNIFLNLIEAVRRLDVSTRILSVGSSEEYGNVGETDLPLTEDRAPRPISPYAVARTSQELLSRVYADGYGMDIILTRSFNHIGPMQKSVFVVPSLARQMVNIGRSRNRQGTIVMGDPTIVRDFSDVRDVANAYYLLLKSGKRGNIYNVCSGIGVSLKDVVDIMARQTGVDVTITSDDRLIRPADNRVIIGSNEKIRRELGWKPEISLERSLGDTLAYWESN
jgi:GDP-4-dehydro-6-deoxy-D-mannose reductase